jgi:hypothetical protein
MLSLVIGTTVYLKRRQQTFAAHSDRTHWCMGNEIADADQVPRVSINESLEPGTSLLVLQLDDVGEGDITTGLNVVFQRGVHVVVVGVEWLLDLRKDGAPGDSRNRVGKLSRRGIHEGRSERCNLALAEGDIGDCIGEGDAIL